MSSPSVKRARRGEEDEKHTQNGEIYVERKHSGVKGHTVDEESRHRAVALKKEVGLSPLSLSLSHPSLSLSYTHKCSNSRFLCSVENVGKVL